MPEHAQHPDQPAGGAPAAVVVADDAVVRADAETAEGGSERLGRRERMATIGRGAKAGQIALQIDEDRPGDVLPREGVPPRATVEVPADVGHDHLRTVGEHPLATDDRGELHGAATLPPPARAPVSAGSGEG